MTSKSVSNQMWAVTSYFNPVRYESRLRNYRCFRRSLQVPLITVELGCGDQFELDRGDSDKLIQLQGSSMLWHKERLLNVALSHVPKGVESVAWLDCDVIIEQPDWPHIAIDLLQRRRLVQLFSELHDLERSSEEQSS